MRIVIVGLGQTGKELAIELINAGHEIIVIDINKDIVEDFTNHYDAIGVVGNGASKETQLKAKTNNADVLVALSPSDEVNIMSCITAKIIGAKHTVVKVSNEEYKDDEVYLKKDLGIDLVVNAELDTAAEITRLIGYPATVKTGAFSNGKVDYVEIKVKENSPLIDVKLTKLKEKFKTDMIAASIIRNEKLIIPRGDIVIQKDDELQIIARNSEIYHFLKELGLIDKPIKSVFMVGCGKIGQYILKTFLRMKLKVKVVEFDNNRCIELAEKFPEATIIQGNGIDSDMLLEEKMQDYDAVISLTGEDETNLVVTLFAWSCKVRKLITKIISVSYTKMLHNVDIDNTLSPHLIVLSSIHRFIRGLGDKANNDGHIKSLYRFSKNMAEAIEFEITDDYKYIGKSLKEVKIKRDVVIAFIIRNHEIIIPKGETTIEKEDRVVIVAPAEKNISNIMQVIDE